MLHTDAYRHAVTQTLAHHPHRNTRCFFFFPPLKHNMEVWEELVEWSISEELYYFEGLLWGRCSRFILKRMLFCSILLFPLLIPSLLFTSGGSVSCFYQWPLPMWLEKKHNKKQMTVQTEKEEHIKHLMTDFCSFLFFFEKPTLDKKTRITLRIWKLLIFTLFTDTWLVEPQNQNR